MSVVQLEYTYIFIALMSLYIHIHQKHFSPDMRFNSA